jgi:hypothetical protein
MFDAGARMSSTLHADDARRVGIEFEEHARTTARRVARAPI